MPRVRPRVISGLLELAQRPGWHEPALALNAAAMAGDVREHFGTTDVPVKLGPVLEGLGVRVRFGTRFTNGSIQRDGKHLLLSLNPDLHPARLRFTVAHEIGHLVLESALTHAPSQLSIGAASCSSRWHKEAFCDAFAANLLIPEEAIAPLSVWETFSIAGLVRKAGELRVSISAAAHRALEVASQDGAYIWFRYGTKPTDRQEYRWRVSEGAVPNLPRSFIPRYASLPEDTRILRASSREHEIFVPDAIMKFGSLRGKRDVLVKSFRNREPEGLLMIALPTKTINHGFGRQNPTICVGTR